MKLYKKTLCLAVILSLNALHGQSQQERIRNIEIQSKSAIEQANPSNLSSPGYKSNASTDITGSTTGMQRPIFLKSGFLSYFANIDNSLSRTSNPYQDETKADIEFGHDFVWSKTFSGGILTNPIDANIAMLTFVGGGSWTKSDHLIEAYESMNTYTTSAYLLCMIQHESGWNYRIGSSYAMVKDPRTTTESFSEFYPNIGATKTFDLPYDLLGFFDIGGGKHLTTSDGFDEDMSTGENWDFTVTLGLKYQVFDMLISPSYRYTKTIYTTENDIADPFPNSNRGRIDRKNTLSLKVDYPLFENINLSANYSFDQVERVNAAANATDYDNWSAGANLGLSLNF